MTLIRDLLERKGYTVWTIDPSESVFAAILKMKEHEIGALVAEYDSRPVGIITERDVLWKAIAERLNLLETQVADLMTTDVLCCSPDTDTNEARGAMRDRRIRHLPVADPDGQLIGLISIGDLNAEIQAEQERTLFLLHEYIEGRT